MVIYEMTENTSTALKLKNDIIELRLQQGWQCPKCGRILAPWVSVCMCSTDERIPWKPPIVWVNPSYS